MENQTLRKKIFSDVLKMIKITLLRRLISFKISFFEKQTRPNSTLKVWLTGIKNSFTGIFQDILSPSWEFQSKFSIFKYVFWCRKKESLFLNEKCWIGQRKTEPRDNQRAKELKAAGIPETAYATVMAQRK